MKPYPDPQKPGAIIMGQEVWVRVHTDTACAIYNSCKRNSFVSSVSAMGSPAGFLNFQGHNALNAAHQYISMNFSNNMNDSLAFSDSLKDFPYDDLQTCDYKTSESLIHNFTVNFFLFSSPRTALAALAKKHAIQTTGSSTLSPVSSRGSTSN